MLRLSNDILMEIIKYLPYNEGQKFSYTCKTINKVSYLKIFWGMCKCILQVFYCISTRFVFIFNNKLYTIKK